ncbi:hypothetical protein EVAR_38379_1 [Eumeta japonica]|uniref:Uncharacterized protein n=1 Tax=Eumeta variegata TaxID=151549 RepID=A0A4C1XVH0_EUMVA|nr:hypothetical protein EVAR_38379_1 [Eumeta japonica]
MRLCEPLHPLAETHKNVRPEKGRATGQRLADSTTDLLVGIKARKNLNSRSPTKNERLRQNTAAATTHFGFQNGPFRFAPTRPLLARAHGDRFTNMAAITGGGGSGGGGGGGGSLESFLRSDLRTSEERKKC